MMISCAECGKTYQIHSKELKKNRGVTTCEICHHQMVVQQSGLPASSDDDPFDILEDLPQLPDQPVSSDDPFDILEDHPQPADQPVAFDTTQPTSGHVHKTLPADAVLPKPAPPEPHPEQFSPFPKRRLSLTLRFALLMLTVTLIPLMVFGVITYKLTSNQGQTYIATLGNRTTTSLAFQVDGWMDNNIRTLQTFAQLPDIISNKKSKQTPLLDAVKQAYPWFRQVVIVAPGGNKDAHPIDYTDRACIQAVMSGKPVAWETVWDNTSGRPLLVLAVPIKTSQGSVVGALAGLMDFDKLATPINSRKQGDTGFAFLVDEAGNRIVYPRQDDPDSQNRNLTDHPLIDAFNAGQTGLIFFEDTHGFPSIGQTKRTTTGWVVGIQQQEKEAFKDLKQAKLTVLLFLGGAFILVFIIALVWGWFIARPINDLVIAANRISIGELGVEIKTKRKDELGDVAEAITRMQDSIRLSIERLRRHRK